MKTFRFLPTIFAALTFAGATLGFTSCGDDPAPEKKEPKITVTPAEGLEFKAKSAPEQSLTVAATDVAAWSADVDSQYSWLHATTDGNAVKVTVDDYDSTTEDRVGYVVVSDNAGKAKEVSVKITQKKYDPDASELSCDKTELNFAGKDAEGQSVTVTATNVAAWSASVDEQYGWLHAAKDGDKVNITVDDSNDSEPRIGYVVVSDDAGKAEDLSIKVTQSGVTKTVSEWDGSTITMPQGLSTRNVLINSAAELAWIASAVNGNQDLGDPTLAEYTFTLNTDIDLKNFEWTPIGGGGDGSTPLMEFSGTFDGAGYTISNLKISKIGRSLGLFGYTRDATVKNVVLNNVDIKGRECVGGVVGRMETNNTEGAVSVVSGCRVSNANIEGVPIDDSYGSYVGGVIGKAGNGIIADHKGQCIVEDCTFSGGTIKGRWGVGGVIGMFSAALTENLTARNCKTTGGEIIATYTIAGGVFGTSGGSSVSNCSFTGGKVTSATFAGGISGYGASREDFVAAGGGIFGCVVSGGTIKGQTAGGISGGAGTVHCCLVYGATIESTTEPAGGIIGAAKYIASSTGVYHSSINYCIASPASLTSSSSARVGVLTGSDVNVVKGSYWSIIGKLPAVGNTTGVTVSNCVSFNKTDVVEVSNFFQKTVDSKTPIETMNSGLQTAGSKWRWQAGTAASNWYPTPVEQQ